MSLTRTNLRKSHFHSYRSLTKGGWTQDADYNFSQATYLRINAHGWLRGCGVQQTGKAPSFFGQGELFQGCDATL